MKKYLTIAVVLLTITACKDAYEVKVPVFNVWTEKSVYAVGEQVKFNIDGSPDMLDFYSGEIGRDYSYHDVERIYNDTKPNLSFRAAKYAGNNEDCAQLYCVKDLGTNYTFEDVKTAVSNGVNLSSRFSIPPIVGTAATFSNAGTADISDLTQDDKPIYLVWHCKTNAGSQRTRFQVMDFNINGVALNNPDLSGVLHSQTALSFKWLLNEATATQASNLPSVTNTLIYWDSIFDNLTGPLKEGYAVSIPVKIGDVMNLGLDKGKVIKGIQNENMVDYFHTFNKPGEYEVAFVGYNVNYKGKKETVKKVKIVVQ